MIDAGAAIQRRARALRAGLSLGVALGALALLALPAGAQALEQKLVAPDGATNDELGTSVAVDGGTAVVGAPRDEGGKGAVYVFTRAGDTWTQTAKLTASDGAANDELGISVAIDGDTIVAGAHRDDGANPNQGSAYTFATAGPAARQETAKLTAADGAADDLLGYSVAIDGDTIVAGSPLDDVGANTGQGSVYTFARTGAPARTQTAKLTAGDGAATDELGISVAIDGDTIVAGAELDDVGANTEQGSAYTFATTGPAARTQTAKLTAGDGAEDDELGWSVAIDGDTIIAGAPGVDIGATADQGSVYTFTRTGATTRQHTAKLTATDGAATDLLGQSVAIDGEAIVAGARLDDVGATADQGSVYTFARTGATARQQTAKLTASDGAANDELGRSVAIDGDTIVAGARVDDVGAAANQGSASIFFAPAPPPPPAPPPGPGVPPPPPPPPPQAEPLFPAKLQVKRARVVDGKLDLLVGITGRADGDLNVRYRAAGRTIAFTKAIGAPQTGERHLQIRRTLTGRQRTLPTGIVEIDYAGNQRTQPDAVRLRAASGRSQLERTKLQLDGRELTVGGTVTRRVQGVVRLRVTYTDANRPAAWDGRATIKDGKWALTEQLPGAAATDPNAYLTAQFTGDLTTSAGPHRGEQLGKGL